MKNKKIVVTAILIIVIINIFSVFNPILLLNLKNAKKICNDYNIIEVKLNSDNEYVSREEFLDSVLYAIGMNEYIIDRYNNTDFGTIPTAILIIVIINIFSVFNPILLLNLKNAKKICNDYNIIEVKLNSDNEYVSREEFLDSVLYAIGMNEYIIDRYNNTDFGTIPTDDFNLPNKQYSTTDNFYTICFIAKDLKLLQTKGNTRCYYGKDNIKVQEAASILQACLSNVETDNGIFTKRSKEFMTLFIKSHFSGIITPLDSNYFTITNPSLKRKDVYILLARLLKQKRYKYLIDTKISEPASQIESKRSMTYKEYLDLTN